MTTSFVRVFLRTLLVGGILIAMSGVALALDYYYGEMFGPVALKGPQPGVSLSGTYLLAFPAETTSVRPLGGMPAGTQKLITDCGTFFEQNGNGQTNIPNIVGFSRYDRANDVFVPCGGFAIEPGASYRLQISADSNFYITGSHGFNMIPLIGPGVPPANGENYVSLPWANITTLRTAKDLLESVGFANALEVKRYLTATDSYQVYTGRKGTAPSFGLVDTMGYTVKVQSTQYWLPPNAGLKHCDLLNGSLPVGTGDNLATSFCDAFTARRNLALANDPDIPADSPFDDFTCTKLTSTPGKIKIAIVALPDHCGPPPPSAYGVVFTGTTTGPHTYGYQMCCSSPLSQSMGTDGNPAVNIDNTTHAFNEFSVTTSIDDVTTQVPALGVGWMIALVGALVATGLWLRSR